MTPTLQADPDCARPVGRASSGGQPADGTDRLGEPSSRRLEARRVGFDTITQETWDGLAARNPYATPFSSWAFQRAWWDGYGANAVPDTFAIVDERQSLVGLAPLMHRHAVEPADATTHTSIRHVAGGALTPVAPTACAIYFGASYHADYATLLADPADLPAAAVALAAALGREEDQPPTPDHGDPWDVLDLRRLRSVDPSFGALSEALRSEASDRAWELAIEREDVCPVIHIPEGADLDGFLGTLDKKERHEIRRKVRRAESAGPIELVESTDPLADLDAFIELHQRRWGDDGLFPDTEGGEQSRRFFRRLFELFPNRAGVAPAVPRWTLHLCFLTVGERRIAASVHFETPGGLLYYNAGVDPEARELSPGVVLLERLVRRAIERGKCRVDLMRGDEPYKYEWGAVDEPIQRILVRRS